jgi:putative acetyltransferase
MAVVEINKESPGRGEIKRLLAEADAYAASLYPPESRHPINADELKAPGVRFFVARADSVAVGCAALLRDGDAGELKRMFVLERARGLGVGRAILRAVEEAALADGVRVLRLESGTRNGEALTLYRRSGYADRGPFGAYGPDPLSVFMEKHLSPT